MVWINWEARYEISGVILDLKEINRNGATIMDHGQEIYTYRVAAPSFPDGKYDGTTWLDLQEYVSNTNRNEFTKRFSFEVTSKDEAEANECVKRYQQFWMDNPISRRRMTTSLPELSQTAVEPLQLSSSSLPIISLTSAALVLLGFIGYKIIKRLSAKPKPA